jgi:hypothetical protein
MNPWSELPARIKISYQSQAQYERRLGETALAIALAGSIECSDILIDLNEGPGKNRGKGKSRKQWDKR